MRIGSALQNVCLWVLVAFLVTHGYSMWWLLMLAFTLHPKGKQRVEIEGKTGYEISERS